MFTNAAFRVGRAALIALAIVAFLAIGAVLLVKKARSETPHEPSRPSVGSDLQDIAPAGDSLLTTAAPRESSANATAGEGSDGTPTSGPLPALPLTERSHPALRRFLNTNATEEERLPITFPTEVPALIHPEEFSAVVALVHSTAETDLLRHQGIELLRRSDYPLLTDVLLQRLTDPHDQPRFRAFVVQHVGSDLANQPLEDYRRRTDALTQALQHPEPSVRREALGALSRVRHRDVVTLVSSTGWSDPLWTSQQDALIDAAVMMDLRNLQPRIRPLAYEADTEVRIAAIVAIGAWRDQLGRPALEEARQSEVFRIQRAAESALRRLDHSPTTATPSAPSPDTASPTPVPHPTVPTTTE